MSTSQVKTSSNNSDSDSDDRDYEPVTKASCNKSGSKRFPISGSRNGGVEDNEDVVARKGPTLINSPSELNCADSKNVESLQHPSKRVRLSVGSPERSSKLVRTCLGPSVALRSCAQISDFDFSKTKAGVYRQDLGGNERWGFNSICEFIPS